MEKPTIEDLRDYAVFLNEVIHYSDTSPKIGVTDNAFDSKNFFFKVIQYYYNKKQKSGLKTIIKELEIMARLFGEKFYMKIKTDAETNFNIKNDTQDLDKKVNIIIKRGVIKNEKEYRLARTYIDIFEPDKLKEKIVTDLIRMLDEFDLKETL